MKNSSLCIICLGLLLSSSALHAQQSLTTELSEQVQNISALLKDSPESAEKAIDALIKGKNKKNISLLVAIGNVYLQSGDSEKAQQYADKAIKIDTKSSLAYLLAGDIALSKRNVGAACGYYEQAILFDDKCYEAYYKYANAYVGVNPQLSLDMLMKLKGKYPEENNVNRELANVYYQMGNYSKAKSAYDEFMTQGVPGLQDYERYGMLLYLSKNYQESLSIVEKGLNVNKDSHLLQRLKMYDLYELGKFEEGERMAEVFFRDLNNPDFVYLDYLYHGRLLLAQKQDGKAMEWFEKALQSDVKKEHPEIAKEISGVYEELQNYPKAIGAYQLYLDGMGDKADISDIFLLGRLYYMSAGASDSEPEDYAKHCLAKADSIFAEVSLRTPENYLGYFWRARTCAMLDPETVDGLAKPYYEAALNVLEKLPKASKSVVIECESYLGYYYFLKKDFVQSKEYWKKILELDPENEVAKQAMKGLEQ